MGSIGNCCCGCCDECSQGLSTNDDAFYHLKFESLAGLHPVSFENDLYVASKCRRTTGGTYGGFNPATALPPDPIHAKVGIDCNFDYLAAFSDPPVKLTEATKMSSAIEACCFAAFAAPADGDCKSAGTQGAYEYSDKFAYTDESEATGLACYPGGIRHTGPDTHTKWIAMRNSAACRRRVEGVALKACYINDAYGNRKLELTAIVTYKDHFNIVAEEFYDYKVDYAARGAEYVDYSGVGGGCVESVPATAAHTDWRCGSAGPHTFSADATIPDRNADCLCVSSSTSGTCTTETIVRKILLDPNCTIKGTHVFASGLSPTAKFRLPCYCSKTSLFLCRGWGYETINCALDPPEILAFPTAYYITNASGWSSRVITTPSSPSTAVTCDSQPTLMNWWTEDWTITIS